MEPLKLRRWLLENPVMIPDRTFVCRAHLLSPCYICCYEYPRKDSEASDSEDVGDVENSSDATLRDGIGVKQPTWHSIPPRLLSLEDKLIDFTPAELFVPPRPNNTPHELFTRGDTWRFFRHTNYRQILVYAGGCLTNGSDGAVGGYAFVYRGNISYDGTRQGIISYPLEDSGPTGILHPHTSSRAKLRAVIAALYFVQWNTEGHKEMVIATDSEYVIEGATKWIGRWATRGWQTKQGREVPNRDLWEMLFKEIQRFKENKKPLSVLFWRIPGDLNTVANGAAEKIAIRAAERAKQRKENLTQFILIHGSILV